ncbi:helix-hairpin-helix domain-containing protein [Corynebacterium caspium]|uniref:helix-hairpin-helix domain-containing protein n=1 Tax=Corynebacterium caspium TaxID=234828 RepID=UPI000376D6D4|nr:helix-hairpin-helix domain-containing protein [Corynebacterium caspium]WKD58858.1 ComE operon protein 1 [Corynebacterium caspium DSM 44850]
MARSIERLKELTRSTGEEDLLKATYPEPRLAISKRQGIALAVLVIVLVAGTLLLKSLQSAMHLENTAPNATAITMVGAGGKTAAAALPELPGVGAGAGAGAGAAAGAAAVLPAAPPSTEIVVSVAGHVQFPGLLTLNKEARVADALAIAQPLPEAQLLRLNAARKLNDGEQIVVLAPGMENPPPLDADSQAGNGVISAGSGSQGGIGGGLVSLNTATTTQLETLPGVGAATATAIIKHRDTIGQFKSKEELLDVKGIGPAKYASLADLITI